MDKTQQNLSGITLLKDIPKEELEFWENRCGWSEYGPHDQIIDRHSESKDVFFIIQGAVRVLNYSISGREIAFDDIQAGSIFGELAAIDGAERSANVIAVTNTLVATLSPSGFKELLQRHPDVALAMMQRLSNIIRSSVERIMDLSTLGANNRVYGEILRLAKSGRITNNESRINPIPNHSDVASRVSTTRETVARVFGELTKKKVLDKSKSTLVVKDLGRLQEMVEEFKGD